MQSLSNTKVTVKVPRIPTGVFLKPKGNEVMRKRKDSLSAAVGLHNLVALKQVNSSEDSLREPKYPGSELRKARGGDYAAGTTPFLDLYLNVRYKMFTSKSERASLVSYTGMSEVFGLPTNGRPPEIQGQTAADFLVEILLRALLTKYGQADANTGYRLASGINYLGLDSDLKQKVGTSITVKRVAGGFRVKLPILAGPVTSVFKLMNVGLGVDQGTIDSSYDVLRQQALVDNTTNPVQGNIHSSRLEIPSSASRAVDPQDLNYLRQASPEFSIDVSGGLCVGYVTLTCTNAEASYLTATNADNIRPTMLIQSLMVWSENNMMNRGKGAVPNFTMPLSTIVRTTVGKSKPRVDTNGLCVGGDGEPLYLPHAVNNVYKYEEAMYRLFRDDGQSLQATGPDLKEMTYIKKDGEGKLADHGVKSMPVILDWYNSKFAYTTATEGSKGIPVLKVEDLSTVVAANPTTYMNILHRPYSKVVSSSLTILSNIGSSLGVDMGSMGISPSIIDQTILEIGKSQGYEKHEYEHLPVATIAIAANPYPRSNTRKEYEAAIGLYDPMQDENVESSHAQAQKIMEQVQGVSDPATYGAGNLVPAHPIAVKFRDYLRTVLAKIDSDPEAIYGSGSVLSQSNAVAIGKMLLLAAENYNGLRSSISEYMSKYASRHPNPDYVPEAVPYITTSKDELGSPVRLQNHQVKTASQLAGMPPYAIIGAHPGGGKTMSITYDILYHMKKGNTGPFIVCCPLDLVADYIKEFVFASSGRINTIPVNTAIFRSMEESKEQEGSLSRIIQAAPVNTVLVVAHNALIIDSMEVGYGTSSVDVFPMVDYLRSYAPSYIAIDEVQKMKNEPTSLHKAARRLVASDSVKYVRIASGTLVDNVLSDLSVVALLNPTVLGDRKRLEEEYTEVIDGKRVPKRGAELAIKSKLFSNMTVCISNRREWARVLPPDTRMWITSYKAPDENGQLVDRPLALTGLQLLAHDSMLVEAMKQASFNDGFSFSKPSSDDRYKDVRVGNIDEFRAAFIKLMNDIKCEPQVYCLARRVTTR